MSRTIPMNVNGTEVEVVAEPRELLLDVLRGSLGLTSVHAACEQGSCGACTVLLDGVAVRSCLLFAVQVDGRVVTTVEGLTGRSALPAVREAFTDCHALQCGFCTPAMVLAVMELLDRNRRPDRVEIEKALSGQLCRCTGYVSIVDAVMQVAHGMPDEVARP